MLATGGANRMVALSVHVFFLVFYYVCHVGQSAIAAGSVKVPSQGSVFLDKFCFDYAKNRTAGFVDVTLHSSSDAGLRQLSLALYDDQSSSFPGQTDAFLSLSCDEQLLHARWYNSIITEASTAKGYHITMPLTERIRPRWWYVALVNCGAQDIDMTYTIHMWNPLHGWEHEFPVDHYGVMQLCIVFLIVYIILLVIEFMAVDINKKEGKETHPLVQCVTASLALSVKQMLLLSIHYICFAWTGQGSLFLYTWAKFARALSKLFLMMGLLLISEGRCISSSIMPGDMGRMFRTLGPFMALCLGLELWSEFGSMRNYTTDYVYSTTPGQLLIFVDVCLLCLYSVNLHRSYRGELDEGKRFFYSSWGSIYGVWFLVLPVTTIVATFLPPWGRFCEVFTVSHVVHICMYGVLIRGLWPSRRHSHFVLETIELEPIGAAWEQLEGHRPVS